MSWLDSTSNSRKCGIWKKILFFLFSILITAFCFVKFIVGLSACVLFEQEENIKETTYIPLIRTDGHGKYHNSLRHTLAFDWVQFNIACVLCDDIDVDIRLLAN